MIHQQYWIHLYILADSKLENTDIGIGLTDLFEFIKVSYKFSDKTFDNSLLWLSAKEDSSLKTESKTVKYIYDTEIWLIYYNCGAFIKDYMSDKIESDFKIIQYLK